VQLRTSRVSAAGPEPARLRLTPEQRLDQLEGVVAFLHDGREALARSERTMRPLTGPRGLGSIART
jgi:hypothetical protein